MLKRLTFFLSSLLVLSACATPAAPPARDATPAAPATGPQNPVAVDAGGSNPATPNASAQILVETVRGALQSREYAKAVAAAQEAVNADPASSGTHYILGNAFNQAGGTEGDPAKRADYFSKAIAEYQKAISINGANGDARHNLGTVYLQLGQIDNARAQFEAALKTDPNDSKTHYMLGTIYLQDDPARSPQSLSRAESEFLTALSLDAKLAEAYVGLAQVFLSKGDPAKALENAKKGVDLSAPNVDPFSYWQLAQAQCATGDKAGGSATLQKVIAAGVPDPNFNQEVQRLVASCQG